MRLYHGGYPGLRKGDKLLPPDVTGTEHRLSAYVSPVATHGRRTDRVYVTTERAIAEAYAAFYPDGALYEVEALSDGLADPDAPDESIMLTEALVRSVVNPVVLLRARPIEAWLRRFAR